jgi:hypothetical protein
MRSSLGTVALKTVAVCGLVLAVTSGQCRADQQHDSNTLHKMGNAIQYVFRKDASNISKDTHKVASKDATKKETSAAQYTVRKDANELSIDAHQAEGKKSVAHDPNGNEHIVTPLPHNKRKHLFP